MLLQFLSVAAILVSPCVGYLDRVEFENYLDPMCVSKDDTTQINGQDRPLPQTLENFISLAEKFEHANPNYGLKNELFYFIRNYTYDNIEYSVIGDVTTFEPKESNFDIVNTLWEPDVNQRTRLPDARDPYEDNEKCSLYYMLSHSIIRKARTTNVERAATNSSRMMNNMRYFNPEDMYPIEIGVVAIRGTERAVDLGRVLRGMYVGLQDLSSRKVSLDTFGSRIPQNVISVDQEKMVDPLYTLTIAEVVALAAWRPEVGNRIKFPASEGFWASGDPETKDICPTLYRLRNGTMSAYSQSSLRGAADGFILGRLVGDIESKHRNVRLSQLLRMYYSRGGISSTDSELGAKWASFCNREAFLAPLESALTDQVRLYQVLVGKSYKGIEDNVNYAMNYYKTEKSSIFGIWNTDLDTYCGKALTVEEVADLPLESPLDIIVVLDTSDGQENYRKQQLIVGHMAKELRYQNSASRITVLTDQREQQAFASKANTGTIQLKVVVPESYSASCAACMVVQTPKDDDASLPEDEVIMAINQLLEQKKLNDSRHNGMAGKVVIYFNFNAEENSARPSPLQVRVDKALRDLHIRHMDVSMYALGKDAQAVKKYGRNDIAFVLSAVDEPESTIGKKLFQKVVQAPATLQYHDCVDGRGENTAIYEDFVSPNAIQHWEMPAKYFYKSFGMKFFFEANYGPIRVCHSRATVSPEEQKTSCDQIDNGQKIEYRHSNPCKSFNDISCSPFYFSIIGVNTTEGSKQDCIDTNMENQCKTLDQIKFKFTHEGIRCNGSSALVAAPLFVLIAILYSFLTKRF